MTQQPHPQRCETCSHYQPYERWTGDCKILNHWLKTGEYELIAQVGCASHCSPRQALPAPDEWRTLYPEVKQMCDACLKKERKDERVRVLDELMKWLEPQDLRLLKQKMWRKLEFLRCEEGTGDGDG